MSNYTKNNKKKELVLIFLLTVVTGYFAAVGFPVLFAAYPAFAIIMGVKYGNKYGMGLITLSSLVLSAIIGLTYASIYFTALGIVYIMTIGIRNEKRASETILKSLSYTFVLFTIIAVALKLFMDIDIVELVVNTIEQNLNSNIEVIESMDYEYDIALLKDNLKVFLEYISIVFPSMVLVLLLIVNSVVYGITSYIVRKNEIYSMQAFRLQDFRLSYKFSLIAIIAFLVSLFMNILNIGSSEVLISNLTVIIFVLLYLQGLGVIYFYLFKSKLSRFLRLAILIFLILNSYLSTFISIFGAIDVIFNFRKMKEE